MPIVPLRSRSPGQTSLILTAAQLSAGPEAERRPGSQVVPQVYRLRTGLHRRADPRTQASAHSFHLRSHASPTRRESHPRTLSGAKQCPLGPQSLDLATPGARSRSPVSRACAETPSGLRRRAPPGRQSFVLSRPPPSASAARAHTHAKVQSHNV